jgi:hypothetical protein
VIDQQPTRGKSMSFRRSRTLQQTG